MIPSIDKPALVGMIHTGPLAGAPGPLPPLHDLLERARQEARLLADAGFDALLVENTHDLPYPRRRAEPETIAALTRVVEAVRQAVPDLPCGVQCLAGANRAALGIAHATGCTFIRCEGFVFGHLADEGWMDADAAQLVRARSALGADNIAIWADIRKKHASHAATADLTPIDWMNAAAWSRADVAVVTGTHTGQPVDPDFLTACTRTGTLPVAIGSGLTAETLPGLVPPAAAGIIGSALKVQGNWKNPMEASRVQIVANSINR